MLPGYWTTRYGKERVASADVVLRGPLEKAWTYRPGGPALGFVRAMEGAAITNVGMGGRASSVSLGRGERLWVDKTEGGAALVTSWASRILVFGDREQVRCLDPKTGACEWSKPCKVGLGLEDSYVVGDVLVGKLAGEFHAVDLTTLQPLWSVPHMISMPLVGDERRVIRADRDVTCHDLRSGKVVWLRSGTDLGGEAYRYGCIWRGRYYVIFGEQLTCLDLKGGKTVWRWPLPSFIHGWHPYDGRAYFLVDDGYVIVDLDTGKEVFRRAIGARVPEPPRLKKRGLTAATRGEDVTTWRGALVVVSETHAFLTNNRSGQIVVLERDTGELVQVAEFEGMSTIEPVIYDNHLLIADFNATVHCFRGAP